MTKGRNRIAEVQATSASAVRALYQHHSGAMHMIEFTFVTANGEELVVAMPHDIAAKLLEEGAHAYEAIQRPLRRAFKVPF